MADSPGRSGSHTYCCKSCLYLAGVLGDRRRVGGNTNGDNGGVDLAG